jgi:hypothetical protein
LTTLKGEQEEKEFWKTVDLKALVNWRIENQHTTNERHKNEV